MRRYLIEADPSVAFHLLSGVNLQLFVRVHRHQHWANIRLCQNIRTHSSMFHHTSWNVLEHAVWRKLALLHRWGFLWSVSVGSLWKLPHCCSFPARQSPAPRPCPGQSGHSPSPGALFLQHPPPAGWERRSYREVHEGNEAPDTVQQYCRERKKPSNRCSYTLMTSRGRKRPISISSKPWYIHPVMKELTSGARYHKKWHKIHL